MVKYVETGLVCILLAKSYMYQVMRKPASCICAGQSVPYIDMSHEARKPVLGVSDQVQHISGYTATEDVQLQKMARGLKFRI